MGFVAKIVSFARELVAGEQAPECRVDLDGGDSMTAHHFAPPGVDAVPLPGDVGYLGDDLGKGRAQLVGYQDPVSPGVAAPGEVRLYSRAGPGVMAVEVWLKGDGTLVARNLLGELALNPDGSSRVGNAIGELAVDAAGNVTWKTALGTNGAGTHAHATPFGPTSAPIPGT